ncbi:branched-chain amino acid aminotransferase [Vulgatibacter incomptus]|uniref:Branched-chain-amino-acid aminotransferase n=1 Tax=Vulgatibacter incomptus TaxID=1391653 RepID=A0A0K1PDN1_9BACT|nr:branched-chain amino acid aminotransferase [Vulgatibacter incomptus]AKU91630.1 Branched-chain amino acid aminotransferase [Vulgatibacter incomptus]
MSHIQFVPAATRKPKPDEGGLGFGRIFTDHMLLADYDVDKGWHGARIVPYGPLSLDPAAAVLHYGQELFEGIKAFRGGDGKVRLFRTEKNCERMAAGAARLCIPPIDPAFMLEMITELVRVEQDWVPRAPGTALYIRPTLIATEPFLGVRPAKTYTFFVVLSPVGAYYAEGIDPVRIWVEAKYVRAARGGLGAVKAGANYAASLLAGEEAKKKGYAQVLWLDAIEHRWFEEVGTMNLFLRIGDEVVTPPLGGSILDGVTRDTAITLLREWGAKVSERPVSIDEVREAHARGELREVFGTGTAAVISPVKELCYHGESLVVGDGKMGELSRRLYDTITGIQYGKLPDTRGWLRAV